MPGALRGLLLELIVFALLSGAVFEVGSSQSGPSTRLLVSDVSMGWTNVTRFPMPPALAGAMMAYDPRSSVFILFGGSDGEPTNGTWAFDSATGAWAQLHPEVSPMARVDAMLVYDTSADAFVLFGGWTETPDGIYHRLADTWVFFTTNSTWVRRDPLSSPSPRSDVAAAYDEANGVTVLFGGFNGTNYLGDMWYYSYTNDSWIPRSGSRMPSARADGRMVYDVQHETFFLFSGNDHSDLLANFHHLGDMWRYSWINNAWTQIFPDFLPVPRTYAVFAADSAHGELLLTGGYGNRSVLGDTWAFNTTNLVWRNITTMDGPTPRMAAVGDYDPRHDLLVLLGGGGRYEIRADTWFFRYPPPIQGSIFLSSPEPVTGEPVQFHSESQGGSGSYVRFSWDFGDGQTGSGSSTVHTFGTPGIYRVVFVVQDSRGNQMVMTVNLPVGFLMPFWLDVSLFVAAGSMICVVVVLLVRRHESRPKSDAATTAQRS